MRSTRSSMRREEKKKKLEAALEAYRALEAKAFSLDLANEDFYGLKIRLAKIDTTYLNHVEAGIELLTKVLEIYKGEEAC